MRHLTLVVLALSLSASPLIASEYVPAKTYVPRMIEASKPVATATVPKLQEVAIEKRASTDKSATAQLPSRGSFWWLVGVVVVAGVILAVLL